MPVFNNYDIARNRLKKCLDKLATKNLLEPYDNVFKEWWVEDIIESVPLTRLTISVIIYHIAQ